MKIFNPDQQKYSVAHSGAVFIRTDRGVLRGTGVDRLDLLHRLSTNATRQLATGEEASTILTTDKGRIVDILRILAFDDNILMVTLGKDVERVRAWLDKYTIMDDFTVADASAEYSVIGLYGETSRALAAGILGTATPDAGRFGIAASGGILVARDARLGGAGGFVILAPTASLEHLLDYLREHGAVELDSDTFEALRVEAGQPALGAELGDAYNPLEAGLVQLVSFTKGCYIGQEVIARLDTYDKVQRHLMGFVLDQQPANGELAETTVRESAGGTKVGTLTSIAFSPVLGRPIGLGYVRTQFAVPGSQVVITGGDDSTELATATLAKLPFDR